MARKRSFTSQLSPDLEQHQQCGVRQPSPDRAPRRQRGEGQGVGTRGHMAEAVEMSTEAERCERCDRHVTEVPDQCLVEISRDGQTGAVCVACMSDVERATVAEHSEAAADEAADHAQIVAGWLRDRGAEKGQA
jgi:hypothetical protein